MNDLNQKQPHMSEMSELLARVQAALRGGGLSLRNLGVPRDFHYIQLTQTKEGPTLEQLRGALDAAGIFHRQSTVSRWRINVPLDENKEEAQA